MRHDPALQALLKARLDAFAAQARSRAEPAGEPASTLRRAAVCIIVTGTDPADGAAHGAGSDAALVLTRRAPTLRAHAGQWALPGGRLEAGEGARAGALREAREEVQLDLDPSAVLGELDDYPTRSGYLITPVVVWAPREARLAANPQEVARIYRIPLAQLQGEPPEFYAIPESSNPVIRYPLGGKYVHAPTAAVIYQFMEVALAGRHTRVAHLEQPVWAWR